MAVSPPDLTIASADDPAPRRGTQSPLRIPAVNSAASRKSVREVTPIYWRTLIEVGVPIEAARLIAWAIARHDLGRREPDSMQKRLISQYSRFICRAGLWRSNLLAEHTMESVG
jgi:hypothetical protein